MAASDIATDNSIGTSVLVDQIMSTSSIVSCSANGREAFVNPFAITRVVIRAKYAGTTVTKRRHVTSEKASTEARAPTHKTSVGSKKNALNPHVAFKLMPKTADNKTGKAGKSAAITSKKCQMDLSFAVLGVVNFSQPCRQARNTNRPVPNKLYSALDAKKVGIDRRPSGPAFVTPSAEDWAHSSV